MNIVEERLTRSRRLWRGIGASIFSRLLTVLAPLITIPIALDSLGATAYGAWGAALSLTAFAGFADLGLGAGLMTKLAAALSDHSLSEARQLVSTAYVTLSVIVGVFIAALWSSAIWVDYGRLVGSSTGSREISGIVLVTLTVYLLNIVVSLIVRVQYAAQQIAVSNFWQGAGSIAGVLATFAVAATAAGPSLFIAVATAAPLVIATANSLLFFTLGSGREYKPSLVLFRRAIARSLLLMGGKFLAIHTLIAISTTTDSLIVANTAGLDAVPEYAIPARIFSVMAVATAVLNGPLWPINVEAMKRGDLVWVAATTRKMAILAGSLSLVLGVIGVLAGPIVIKAWLDGAISPSTILLAGLAAALLVQSASSPYFMVQNAAAVLKPQLVGYGLLTVTFPIKWAVSTLWGFEYIPYVSAIGFIVFLWPAVSIGYKRSMRQSGAILLDV